MSAITGNLDALTLGVPTLALIGLTVGRELKALKSLSWKIVLVALITYSASFLGASALGQIALQ